MTQTQACTHKSAHVGLDAAHCPDCGQEFSQWSKEYKRLLNQDTRVFAVSSAECPAYAAEESQKPDSTTCFESPSSLKQIPIAGPSLPDSTPAPRATPTSELSDADYKSSIAWQEDHHARELVEPIPEVQDLMTNAQGCGEKCIASSTSAVPDLLSGKMLPLPDTQNQDNECLPSEEFCGILPASGIAENGKLSVQPSVERHTCANECSLLPTPMAHSRARDKYRPPGQDKLEQKLRQVGAIPPGQVSHPALREWMQGMPDGWTDITVPDGGPPMNPPPQSASPNEVYPTEQLELPLLEIVAQFNRPQSRGEELHTSLDFFKPGTLVWSERSVEGKGIVRITGTVTGNTVRSIKLDSKSDLPPIDTVLVRVRWDGNTSDSLIPPAQLQVLKELPIMIAVAPNQTPKQSATHTRLSDTKSGSQVQILTDASEASSGIPELELQSEPEPECMPLDAPENQATFSAPTAAESQENPDYLEEEVLVCSRSEIEFLVNPTSALERSGTEKEAEVQTIDEHSTATHVCCEIVNDSNALAESEQLECERLEETIQRGRQSFYEMGQALSIIRDKRLYRTYGTFEEYCYERWEMSRRAAYQLIDAAAVVDNVRNCAQIFPANEAQARPLAKLSTREQQQQAWLKVVSTAPSGKVTAEHVVSVVKEFLPVKQKTFSALQQLGTDKINAGSEGSYVCDTLQSKNDSRQVGKPTAPLDNMSSLMSDGIKAERAVPVKSSPLPTSVKEELSKKALELGLPDASKQVLPDVRRNNISPADVDDRPFIYSPPPPIPVDTNEICTNFIGSIEYLSHEHIVATVSELATRTNPKKLDLMRDEELKLFVNKLNLLAETAIALLTKRHNPSTNPD